MKGLLLAGGHGTRLRPLTFTGNKHLLPIANKPMVLYGLEHLRNAGIKDIAVVLGPLREGFEELVGDGSKFGVHLSYIEQPVPKGLAHAALISEDYMNGSAFIMYLGDNLLNEGVGRFKQKFEDEGLDCVIGVAKTKDPSRFGVVEIHDGKVKSLVEKPKEPKSDLALVGVYVFGERIFDSIKKIKPSARNELEITEAIQQLLDDGGKVGVQEVSGWWKDTGRPEDLLEANQLVLSGIAKSGSANSYPDASLTGNVEIGEGTMLKGNVTIRGPVIIGDNCRIGPNVYIGPYTSIGNGCTLEQAEIENSIVMNGANIETGKRISDSLIGSNSTIRNGETSLPKGYKLVIGERSFAQI